MRESTAAIVASIVETSHQVVLHHQHIFDHKQTFFTSNVYCWSRKIIVTIYWTHLRRNGICAKSFMPTENEEQKAFP